MPRLVCGRRLCADSTADCALRNVRLAVQVVPLEGSQRRWSLSGVSNSSRNLAVHWFHKLWITLEIRLCFLPAGLERGEDDERSHNAAHLRTRRNNLSTHASRVDRYRPGTLRSSLSTAHSVARSVIANNTHSKSDSKRR